MKPYARPEIRYKTGERVITVFLSNQDPRGMKPFHCINCGFKVFEYNTDIMMLYDGTFLKIETAMISQVCKSCRTVYQCG